MKKADDALKKATGVKLSPKPGNKPGSKPSSVSGKKPATAPGKKPATALNNKAGTGATKSTDEIIKEVMNRNKSSAGPTDDHKK